MSEKRMNAEVTINDLFEAWESELGRNKAILLSCCYPVGKVLGMSAEEAESEVDAINYEV